jgi:tetratricopeptide (TPR) repeat protein
MKQSKTVWVGVVLILALGPVCAWLGSGAAAQGIGNSTIVGDVKDQEAKPFPDVTVIITNEQGRKWTLKTDKNGHFSQDQLSSGIYTIAFQVKDKVVWEIKLRAGSGGETRADVNFKELIAKQGAAAQEELKKQEAEKTRFESLKTHFDAGVAALDQARQTRTEMQRAPADQRATLQAKLGDFYGTAVTEFQAAEKAAGEKDQNRHLVLAKLGESYENAGRYEEAVNAYQQAVTVKPDVPGYYNNLGNNLARVGKIQEAGASYEKSATLDPANAANAWRNFGIVLYNVGRMKEAVGPLKKAIELDPKNAQGWYLLGAALVNLMDSKQEGDKVIPILQPGTIEAYQKAVELDPNGPYGVQAKQGLEALEQMGVGIQTKVKTRTKK